MQMKMGSYMRSRRLEPYKLGRRQNARINAVRDSDSRKTNPRRGVENRSHNFCQSSQEARLSHCISVFWLVPLLWILFLTLPVFSRLSFSTDASPDFHPYPHYPSKEPRATTWSYSFFPPPLRSHFFLSTETHQRIDIWKDQVFPITFV